MGEPPEFTFYFGQTPSYDYIRESLLELVVAYVDYGEMTYRRDGAWGVEVQDGAECILTGRESAHMRWAENFRPGRPFRVLPNDVVRWLWQRVSLVSLRRQRISREGFRRDQREYVEWNNAGRYEFVWTDNQNRCVSVRVEVPWRWLATSGHWEPYQVFEARPFWEDTAVFQPLVFSLRSRRWLMTGLPGAGFVDVPPGAVRWLQTQVARAAEPAV